MVLIDEVRVAGPAGFAENRMDLGEDSADSGEDKMDSIAHLLFFASQGNVESVRELLEEGADVNGADYDDRTALHLASSENQIEMVKLLLDYGADPNLQDRWKSTPLTDAMHYHYAELCKLLQSRGARIISSPTPSETADFEIDVSELDTANAHNIGKGVVGDVNVVNWRGTRVAVKTLRNASASDQFTAVLKILQKLRHPNIVQFLGAVTTQRPFMIVTEYLPRGNLHQILEKEELDAVTSIRFGLDIARGMNYLHQHRPPIVHRDLKPTNLLRDAAGHMKVGDFGLGMLLQRNEVDNVEIPMLDKSASWYMAPELKMKQPFDMSVDVYAFGVIFAEMFEGPLTKQKGYRSEELESVSFRPYMRAKKYPPGIKELIKECWSEDPKSRPTFAKVIERLEALQKTFPSRLNPPPAEKESSDYCRCIIL